MDAAADYAAARAMLTRPLPAFVSYAARTHLKFDAINRDESSTIVVRTRDGKIVSGAHRSDFLSLHVYAGVGVSDRGADDPLGNTAFVPRCYVATGSRMETYDSSPVEAIALGSVCRKGDDDDDDFETIYVDPATKRPIAAVGTTHDDPRVVAKLEQRFMQASGYIVPSSLDVRVKGSGLMAWLDVWFDGRYAAYRFDVTRP